MIQVNHRQFRGWRGRWMRHPLPVAGTLTAPMAWGRRTKSRPQKAESTPPVVISH